MDTSMNESKKAQQRLVILYGSQTGTAQDVAENIAMQSRGTHFISSVEELDSYPIHNLIEEDLVIFVCSTTGQGEPPDNMRKFWRFIMRKNLPGDSLHKLKYGVLGLGDSSYTKYNFIAKKLDRRIQQLGGHKLLSLGLADDQHEWGADATVDPWVTSMWTELLKIYPLPTGVLNPLQGSLPPPRFRINSKIIKVDEIDRKGVPVSYCRDHPFQARVKTIARVTPLDHFQNTVHVVLDISGSNHKLDYKPGDVVMIRPSNIKDNVERFLETFLHLSSDDSVIIQSTDAYDCLPTFIENPTTLRNLATEYLDFMSVPRRSFFQMLQHFASDELEKEKLVEFAIPEGTDERYSYANRPRRNILEVFQDFHKTIKNISLCRLLELIPRIQPRAFSIASSPSKHRNEIHILVAIVKYKTMLQIPRQGLCSTWLSTLNPGSVFPIWIKTGGIKFPLINVDGNKSQFNNTPCIMIGPGTGVAPFRSAIHERVWNKEEGNVLFFGCRNKNADFYFHEEWDELIQNSCLELHTAFSRDQDDKIYVQHRITEHGQRLWDLINNHSANIYIAGSSKNMPDGVKDAFLKIFKDFGEMSKEEACKFYETMQKDKKYQQETWS